MIASAWLDVLKARFPGRLHHDEYRIRTCPYCGNPKSNCEVNVIKLVFKCWACGTGGTVRGIFYDFGLPVGLLPDTPIGRREFVDQEQLPVMLPAECRNIFDEGLPMSRWALQYLTSDRPAGRAMSPAQVNEFGIQYTHDGDWAKRVIWPLYENDELVYFVARRFMRNAGQAYKYPEFRRRSLCPVYTGTTERLTLVLVEGVFEIPNIHSLGYSVMPLLGSEINPAQVEKLTRRNFKRYIVFLDRDAVQKSIVIAERLRAERLDAYFVCTDGPDSDELPFDELEHLLDSPRRPGTRVKVMAKLGRL